jgi:hypothetical protein
MNSPTHQWVFFFSILASSPCLPFPVPHQGKTPIFPKITLSQIFNENLIGYKLIEKDSRATKFAKGMWYTFCSDLFRLICLTASP